MRTLTVQIHKQGQHNEPILRAIGGNNEGKAEISLNDIAGYVRMRAAEYPSLYSGCIATVEQISDVLTGLKVSEDGGKTFTLSISQSNS